MKNLGILTGADLRAQSHGFLQQHFGKSGEWYYAISRGEDYRSVEPERERKSSGSETTFAEDLTEPQAIEAGVTGMAGDVWNWCEKTGVYGRTVTVKIKYADFKQITRSKSFSTPVTTAEALREASIALTRTVYPVRTGIRLVGVTVSNFNEPEGEARQLGLGLLL
jgi:DNA polymerase-4